jgi:predicted nucleic acid-binding protein
VVTLNLFFDTSVLVASSSANHPHYPQARRALEQTMAKGNQGWMSQHSIAEVYSILTSAPLVPRIQPTEALQILEENLLPRMKIVTLDPLDYREVIHRAASEGWRSGRIYDALLLQCAGKNPVDRIYTFNLRDFVALAPERLRTKIAAPA